MPVWVAKREGGVEVVSSSDCEEVPMGMCVMRGCRSCNVCGGAIMAFEPVS